MKTTKLLLSAAVVAATLSFTGCTKDQENLALASVAVVGVAAIASHADGSHTGNYYHNGYDYGTNRNYSYRDGVREGCQSRSYWSQNSYRYDHDRDYRDGWRSGYSSCR